MFVLTETSKPEGYHEPCPSAEHLVAVQSCCEEEGDDEDHCGRHRGFVVVVLEAV